MDQQKDDAARLTVRLSGTEKQRDDALEALVLQQEIAEELERERKRNKKELSVLQHANKSISRQRDEAQRVVVHLRALISGQTHHMEHIVRSLNQAPEITGYIGGSVGNGAEDSEYQESVAESEPSKATGSFTTRKIKPSRFRLARRSNSPTSSVDGAFKAFDGEHVTAEMERSFFNSPAGLRGKRFSELSMGDVADRHLREKTDAIADIIRNISDQCAAAVEGLQLAHDAELDDDDLEGREHDSHHVVSSENGHEQLVHTEGSELGEGVSETGLDDSSYLSPEGRNSSVPPTPELVHNRSSTSMSMVSSSTVPDRGSHQYSQPSITTKILHGDEMSEGCSELGIHENGSVDDHKYPGGDFIRPTMSRIVT